LGISLNWRLADDDNAATFGSVILGDSEILFGTIDFVPPADQDKRGTGIQLHVHGAPEVDIEQLFKRARDKEAKIAKEIKNRERGERAFVVHDLDGYNLMIDQQRV
jgi:uncharacterized glyoxalase superfamily protein PhnB